MKKLLVTILAVGMMATTSVTAFAATPAANTFVCPNGYVDCTQNGACLDNGVCVNHETCVENGVCQYPESCPNGGVPKSDGTGYQQGGHGRGHHGGGRGGHCARR